MRTTKASEGSSGGTYHDLLSSLSLCDNSHDRYLPLFNSKLPFCSPILPFYQASFQFLHLLSGDILYL